MLGGIGFTVSLLIGELAFGGGPARRDDHVKVAVLTGSLSAAAAGRGPAADPQPRATGGCGRRRSATTTTTAGRTCTGREEQ